MIFNTVFVIWGLQILMNFLFFGKGRNLRYKAGCFIWVGFAALHLINGFYLTGLFTEWMRTEDERISGQWAQSPGIINPFTIFITGFLGSIILQIIFNTGIKPSQTSMPDTYGTGEGEQNE